VSSHDGNRPLSKGVLQPSAPGVSISRVAPGANAQAFVRHYWMPRWNVPEAGVRQNVLEYPSSNLVIEADAAALYGAQRGRSSRELRGVGWAFGVLMRPGTTRRLVSRPVRDLVGATIPLGELTVPDSSTMVDAVRAAMHAGHDDDAVASFESWLGAHPLAADPDAELVDRIVERVEQDRGVLRVEQLAAEFGLGVRRLQRLVSDYVGFGPKWLIQRYRLQEAAAALGPGNPPRLAELAAALGYADQSHFTRDFRRVVGEAPARYAAGARARQPVDEVLRREA
jgi:AraC-like DNA-binding protein